MKKRSYLKGARNIGATIEKRLNEIGVFSLEDLKKMTPVKAYAEICRKNPGKTIPVCYYLYSLQGALLNIHWNDLPEKMKKDLLHKLDKLS